MQSPPVVEQRSQRNVKVIGWSPDQVPGSACRRAFSWADPEMVGPLVFTGFAWLVAAAEAPERSGTPTTDARATSTRVANVCDVRGRLRPRERRKRYITPMLWSLSLLSATGSRVMGDV